MLDSISSASIERIRTSLLVRESGTAASKYLALDSQLIKVPLFSTTAATGRTTSAIWVTALWRISSETIKAFSIIAW